jgi:hypothetical protein
VALGCEPHKSDKCGRVYGYKSVKVLQGVLNNVLDCRQMPHSNAVCSTVVHNAALRALPEFPLQSAATAKQHIILMSYTMQGRMSNSRASAGWCVQPPYLPYFFVCQQKANGVRFWIRCAAETSALGIYAPHNAA